MKRKTRGWPYDVSLNKKDKTDISYAKYKIYKTGWINWITYEQRRFRLSGKQYLYGSHFAGLTLLLCTVLSKDIWNLKFCEFFFMGTVRREAGSLHLYENNLRVCSVQGRETFRGVHMQKFRSVWLPSREGIKDYPLNEPPPFLSGLSLVLHWKLKRSVSAPNCQFSPAGQSLIQPFLERFEHNLGQSKGYSSPR